MGGKVVAGQVSRAAEVLPKWGVGKLDRSVVCGCVGRVSDEAVD